jgi:GGDEF domain-containing protein
MTSEPRSVQVVIVSEDTALLHEISWILEAVGYRVKTTKDFDQHALWRRYTIADVVIVDARRVSDPVAATFAIDSENPHYRIFLYDPAKPTDFAAWFAAGAHDALHTPISRGELLARVRTGARYLEFERRLASQSSRSAIPGMDSRRGFLRKLRKLAAADESGSPQHSMLVTSIDWYAGIRQKCGDTVSRGLSAAVAKAIKRAVGDGALSAYFGDGRFATLLVGQTLAAAKSAAESLAQDFAGRESRHESIPRPTLTSAVMSWPAGANAERFVSEALETLELAEHSGGDCVIQHGDFWQELVAWQSEMAEGNPFADVVAQDIMEPFPALLLQGAEQPELAEALERSGISVRPFVDGEGRLVGVSPESTAAADTHIGDVPSDSRAGLVMPETISHSASFPEIYEAFSTRGCSTLVVVAGEHPLGYLSCDGFLSMIDPINAESFLSSHESAEDLSYLIVPSTIGEPVGV